jgi:FdrA protein
MTEIVVHRNTYFDSATLMAAAQRVKKHFKLRESVAVMGTPNNKALLIEAGFDASAVEVAMARDLVIGVAADDKDSTTAAAEALRAEIADASPARESAAAFLPATIGEAANAVPGLNMALISTPGEYAALEAHRALDAGLHVMMFSDNVSLADEKSLKEKAAKKGLLMMGPDCGTAIINGVPLAFANVVKRGRIGIVAAAGTGLQEVACLIDRLGGGVSQGIGTGGRDVKDAIGGLQMIQGIRALMEDDETDVVVIVSKPPQPRTLNAILREVMSAPKPVVIAALGSEPSRIEAAGAVFAGTLADAANRAVEACGIAPMHTERTVPDAATAVKRLDRRRRYLRALYTGGTLCHEALILISGRFPLKSNVAIRPKDAMPDPFSGDGHIAVDLGEDIFTHGRPHPMIEPSIRVERLERELRDPELAVILLDCVLGYGSHADPAGAMEDVVKSARMLPDGGPVVVASVTGTEADPQRLNDQVRKLMSIGVHVLDSNRDAVFFAADCIECIAMRGYAP